MKTLTIPSVVFLSAFALLAAEEPSAPQRVSTSATPAPTTPAPEPSLRGKLNFKPVGRGAPAGRVDAGSRGDGEDIASLYVLAPEEVGLTTRAQPSLYWYQTKPARIPFEFSLLRPGVSTPVLRIRKAQAAGSGFQHIDLKAHGVSLDENVDYQWVVALIRDPESRSRDIISSGWIRRVATPRALAGNQTPRAYAANSVWYETVSSLFEQISARPMDLELQSTRSDLLTQVGLPPLADPIATSKRHH